MPLLSLRRHEGATHWPGRCHLAGWAALFVWIASASASASASPEVAQRRLDLVALTTISNPDTRPPPTSASEPKQNVPPLTEALAREIPAERYAELFTPLTPPPSVPTGWAYTAHGLTAFLPLSAWSGAGLLTGGAAPFLATGVNALAAGVLGSLPAGLGYLYSNPVRARWRDLDVALFGLSLLLTPPLAGLGAWSSQALLFGGHTAPARAFWSATAGALVGHLLGMGLETLLRTRLPLPELGDFRFLVGVACVGTGAALGQALAERRRPDLPR